MSLSAHDEALFGRLPLLRHEREYGTRGILATGFAYAVAAWCFLIGGYAANMVSAGQGIVALICGSVIGVTVSAAAAALGCNRYGLEQIDFTKISFGQRGAKAILAFYVINQVGWTGMILVMFARSANNVLAALGVPVSASTVSCLVLFGLVAAYLLVVAGVHTLNVFNTFVTPGLVLMTGLLFYVLWRDSSLSAWATRAALAPAATPELSYVIAFEYGLGAGFSWWPGIGFLTRNADGQRASFYPQVLTMGWGMGVVCCAGLLAGLMYRTFDPSIWMVQACGPLLGALALAVLAIANLSAGAVMMYTAGLALKHIPACKRLRWPRLAAVAFIPVLAFVVWPNQLYDGGSAFLTYNATMFAPISGILFVDYILLRGGRLNLSQIFENDAGGDYWFVGGINPVAVGCMLVGQLLYVYLLDPVSNTPHGPTAWTTATGPAVVGSMVLYFVLMHLWLRQRPQVGGYGASTAPRPLRRCNL